jgi:uncharacterized cofD-like protein
MVVIGPGSLYTSILPNLRVRGITEALRETDASKIYICNVATQKGETAGYSVADHLEALQRHTFPSLVDYVVANDDVLTMGVQFSAEPVLADDRQLIHATLERASLADPEHPLRHDSKLLAQAVIGLYDRGHNGKSNGKSNGVKAASSA